MVFWPRIALNASPFHVSWISCSSHSTNRKSLHCIQYQKRLNYTAIGVQTHYVNSNKTFLLAYSKTVQNHLFREAFHFSVIQAHFFFEKWAYRCLNPPWVKTFELDTNVTGGWITYTVFLAPGLTSKHNVGFKSDLKLRVGR